MPRNIIFVLMYHRHKLVELFLSGLIALLLNQERTGSLTFHGGRRAELASRQSAADETLLQYILQQNPGGKPQRVRRK
jgi:hypothetical protein